MKKIKYKTKDEKDKANRQNSAKYYVKNKKEICKKRMQRYWEEKEKN